MGTRLCGGVSTAAAAGMDERGRSIAGRVDTSTRSGGAPSSSISAAMLGQGGEHSGRRTGGDYERDGE